MNTTQQPEALRIAEEFESFAIDHQPDGWPAIRQKQISAAAAELRRLHAENTTLQAGYDAARLEIESLKAKAAPAVPAAVVPDGWKFDVATSDNRVWLTVTTPHGASAALSTSHKNFSGHATIAAQVLFYLRDMLAAAPQLTAVEQPDAQLCQFYGVTTAADLIAAQARHIEKLQAKLSATPTLAPSKAREG